MKEGKSFGGKALLIILLAVVVYLPSMGGGFIWDDDILITENRVVRANDGLYRFWFTTDAADYYPLTGSLWWLEWRLWGNSPVGYRVVNLALHAANAVLLWLILRRLNVPGAWLAGLVFAIHPVNVATVAWISEQKNTLSMLFYALAILLYLKFEDDGHGRWYGLSLAAFLLALFSKAAVVTLPVALLGCVWWRQGRVRWRDLLHTVPFFVLSLVLGLVTMWFQYEHSLKLHPMRMVGFPFRLAAAGWVPWFYLYKALLPFNLCLIYPLWKINASSFISYVPGAVLVGCLALFWWKRKTWGRPWFFALGYFGVTLFPVLGFFDQSFYEFSLVADHWQYYSIIAVIALVVGIGDTLCRRTGQQGQNNGAVLAAAVLMLLGLATWTRSSVYGNPEALWRDTEKKNPDAWIAHTYVGLILCQQGRLEEAISEYEWALRDKPDFFAAYNDLGVALEQAGREPKAIEAWERALQIKPDFIDARINLANARLRAGQVAEAIEQYEQVLRIDPNVPVAHSNLGVALEQAGRMPEAIEQWKQALRIQPDFTLAQSNLARVQGTR